jgi:hypothetical protein
MEKSCRNRTYPGFRSVDGGAVKRSGANSASLSRRHFLAGASRLGLAGLLGALNRLAWAGELIELPFANGRRELVTNFPQKAERRNTANDLALNSSRRSPMQPENW